MAYAAMFPQALVRLAPGAEWSMLDAADLSTLVWLDRVQTQPTPEQINRGTTSAASRTTPR
jgi:hypothetical protein